MLKTDTIKQTLAQVVSDRKSELSPGRMFVEACLRDGLDAAVEYDVTITDSLTSSRRKPRNPARNMLRTIDLSRDPRRFYWHEAAPAPEGATIEGADVRRELASTFHKSPIPELLTTTAWVQVPEDLWQDPDTFENFLNYRLIVRLCTAENYTIISGPGGLLHMPEIERMTEPGPFASTILRACNE